MEQTIFDLLYPPFKIKNKVRTIELFGGYGSQLMALKYLGVDVEQWKLCEWAVKSIQAYKDLHCENDNTDYSKDLSVEQIKEYLLEKGISSNYNEPMTRKQIDRLKESQARTIYNNIRATHNLVDIQQVKGADLEIVDQEHITYLLTYSFPCQDLSLAGKRQLMSDTSTRSGLLWEVERILDECKELGTLPQILLMENVIQVHGEGAVQDFNKWYSKLEELGYKNYWHDMIATDYGIPQTRKRCFMVSVLGNYSYKFPKPIPLKLKLKDMLEDNVDEKYYLSEKMLKGMINTKFHQYQLKNRLQDIDGVIDTLTTATGERSPHCIAINNNNNKGYALATDGDGIDISSRMKWHRGTVQKEKAQTITTQCDNGVLQNTRIRKLTPKECLRLMGLKDEDIDKMAKNQSDSSLYHLAGDSIVIQCLEAIFRRFYEV